MHKYLICVATVNGPDRLEAFLKSVREHTVGLHYTIAVCDDNSDVSLAARNHELAVKYSCLYTRNPTRSGVPFSWNRAAELADSQYVVIANDDIVVCPGWLHAFDAFYERNGHLKLGVLAWPATNDLSQISSSKKFTVDVDVSHLTTPIVACSGYLFGMSRAHFNLVEKFDQRYFATWEEIDFGAKLCMNGIKSVGLNGPVIYHEGGASFRDPINQHPAMIRQSQAQQQWIDKWSLVLNINKKKKSHQQLIKAISDALTAKLPTYSHDQFNAAVVDLDK